MYVLGFEPIKNKIIGQLIWFCINGHLVAKVMMTEVKVVCGHWLFELEVLTCKKLKIW